MYTDDDLRYGRIRREDIDAAEAAEAAEAAKAAEPHHESDAAAGAEPAGAAGPLPATRKGHKGFIKGRSGNPNGRPRGARNKRTLLSDVLREGEADAMARVCIDRAMEGDGQALRLCMDRLQPKGRGMTVTLDLPEIDGTQDAALAHGRVLDAVAAGEITPDEGEAVMRLIGRTEAAVTRATIADILAPLTPPPSPEEETPLAASEGDEL